MDSLLRESKRVSLKAQKYTYFLELTSKFLSFIFLESGGAHFAVLIEMHHLVVHYSKVVKDFFLLSL